MSRRKCQKQTAQGDKVERQSLLFLPVVSLNVPVVASQGHSVWPLVHSGGFSIAEARVSHSLPLLGERETPRGFLWIECVSWQETQSSSLSLRQRDLWPGDWGGGGAPKRGTHARPTPPSRIYTFLHVYWGDCGRSIYPLLGREGSPVQQLEPSIQNRVQVHCSYGRCPPARGPNRAAKHGDERPGRRTRVGCQ